MTRRHLWTVAAIFAVLLLAGPAEAGQASMLDSSEVSAFMGTWAVVTESPRGGTFDLTLTLWDDGSKVAARFGHDCTFAITDIAKDGDNLVLTFEPDDVGSRSPTWAPDGCRTFARSGRSGRFGNAIWSRAGRELLFTDGVILTLTLDGEMLNAIWTSRGEQFSMSGTGRRTAVVLNELSELQDGVPVPLAMPLQSGTTLGHYDVTSLLGEGGMGQV